MYSFANKLLLCAVIVTLACSKDPEMLPADGYDIILVAGQSNTHQGPGFDPILDAPQVNIKQLGRTGPDDLKILVAREPLQHWTAQYNEIGFALTFAKEYSKKYLQKNRYVLIIPCGHGETGLDHNDWNKGDPLYEDLVERTRYGLSMNSNNKLVAILWQQGESDIGWTPYQQALDSMIMNMRRDIQGDQEVPFLLGGMVPYWVSQDTSRINHQSIIANTPTRVPGTGFVSPYYPTIIRKADSTNVPLHYDAACQRILGLRYFKTLDSLLKQ